MFQFIRNLCPILDNIIEKNIKNDYFYKKYFPKNNKSGDETKL